MSRFNIKNYIDIIIFYVIMRFKDVVFLKICFFSLFALIGFLVSLGGCSTITSSFDSEMTTAPTTENVIIEDNVFNFTSYDFIENYNTICKNKKIENTLSGFNDWVKIHQKTPFNNIDAINHRFSADEKIWSMPTISLFTAKSESEIYEILLTFDEHAYREDLYQEFKKMSICTLSAVFVDLEEESITRLYNNLYEQTKTEFLNDVSENSKSNYPSIKKLYCCENIGVYGYYGGGTANICIIPLTTKKIDILKEYGIEILYIDF